MDTKINRHKDKRSSEFFKYKYSSGGGPIHARVPIHAHPQFSQRFVLFDGKDVYHIIDNYQIDNIHCVIVLVLDKFRGGRE